MSAAQLSAKGEALKMIAPVDQIESRMLFIREQKVMLSQHLAELYEVEPRALNQAVKRNIARFPEDFMFQLNTEELGNLKSQFVTSSWGGTRMIRANRGLILFKSARPTTGRETS